MNIRANNFVLRQTEDSRFSHFDGLWDEVEAITEVEFYKGNCIKGFRDGVFLVRVPAEGFFTSIVPKGNRKVHKTQEARREGEAKVPVETVAGDKTPAQHVEVILYSHEALAENDEQSFEDTTHEIVSINASPIKAPVPMRVFTMARNHLGMTGGTKCVYPPEMYVRSLLFWAHHAMVDPTI